MENHAAAQAEEETAPSEAEEEAGPGPEDLQRVQGDEEARAQERMERMPVQLSRASVSYLVRTEDSDGTNLQLFTYDPKYDISAQGELVAYLTSVIELNRYATGPGIAGVWRWNGDDSRDTMHLILHNISPEMDDFQDEYWRMAVPGEDDAISFTVRIDRKGQQ